MLGGAFNQFNGVSHGQIVRLNADGSLDPAFQGSSATAPNGSATLRGVTAIAVQDDGKIFVGGDFSSVNGVNRSALARLNGDGTLDTAFAPGNFYSGYYNAALVVQPDGKPVVAGSFLAPSAGSTIRNVARYNADGSTDVAFDPGQGVADARCLALQPDGKVIVGGNFTAENQATQYDLARLYGDATPYLPTVSYLFADGDVRSTTVLARAVVNAHGTATMARVEYGPTRDYGASTPAQGFASNANASFNVVLTGLQPSTVYHYRCVATNHNGTVSGQDLTVTTLSIPADWRLRYSNNPANAGSAADPADPDGDGISNLLERAFGLDPTVAGVSGLPAVSVEAGTRRLVLSATRGGADAADLVFTAEASADLLTWTTENVTVLTNTATGFQARDDAPTVPRRFLRLRVTLP